MTVADALARGIPDAPRLLAHVLQRERAWLIAHPQAPLNARETREFAELGARRSSGEPLAYLLESAGFYGREFRINRSVLIPRPETEHLVEEAIAFLRARPGGNRIVNALDLGVGSGAIACTLAAEVAAVRVDGVDVSADALEVAQANAQALGIASKCRFLLGDLLDPLTPKSVYAVIVANLPYVPTREIAPAPDAVSFEPRLALDGGRDGLEIYRRLLPRVGVFLEPGGLLLLEAAPPLMLALERLVRESFARAKVEMRCDYGGRQRFVRVLAE